MSEQAPSHKVERILEQLPRKLTRQVVGSLVGCVHGGMCHEACHYALAFPDEVIALEQAGVDVARNLYGEAGQGLADAASGLLQEKRPQ